MNNIIILILGFFLLFPTAIKAALLMDANNEQVNVGTMGSWDPTVFTVWGWIYPTALSAQQGIFQKGNTASPFQRVNARVTNTTGGDFIVLKTGTTNLGYRVVPSPFTTNSWQFFAVTMDTGAGTGAKVKVYRGTLSAAPVASTMSVDNEGAGLHSHSTYSMFLGVSADDEPCLCRLANVAFIDNVVLSANQIKTLWMSRGTIPAFGTRRGYWELGFNGTSTQPDWSGNGYNGTVTGATVVPHVPLRPPFAFESDGEFYAKIPEQSKLARFDKQFDKTKLIARQIWTKIKVILGA